MPKILLKFTWMGLWTFAGDIVGKKVPIAFPCSIKLYFYKLYGFIQHACDIRRNAVKHETIARRKLIVIQKKCPIKAH